MPYYEKGIEIKVIYMVKALYIKGILVSKFFIIDLGDELGKISSRHFLPGMWGGIQAYPCICIILSRQIYMET